MNKKFLFENSLQGIFKLKTPNQNTGEPYTLNLKMKKSERGMFLVYEEKEKELFSVRERVTFTGNMIDPNRRLLDDFFIY